MDVDPVLKLHRKKRKKFILDENHPMNERLIRKDREIFTFFTSVTTFYSHISFLIFLCDRKTNEIRKIGRRLDDKVGCFREQ